MRSAERARRQRRIVHGDWTGEIVGSHRVEIGQQTDAETGKPVEFSYLLMPVIMSPPAGAGHLPGVLTIFAETGRERDASSVGTLQEGPLGISVVLSLDATLTQFSNILVVLASIRSPKLRFTLAPAVDAAWAVNNWAISGAPHGG